MLIDMDYSKTARIEETLKRISPYPWVCYTHENKTNQAGKELALPTREYYTIETKSVDKEFQVPIPIVSISNSPYYEHKDTIQFINPSDANFIAQAPDFIDFLVTRVNLLESIVKKQGKQPLTTREKKIFTLIVREENPRKGRPRKPKKHLLVDSE